jgi:hypothetical protein
MKVAGASPLMYGVRCLTGKVGEEEDVWRFTNLNQGKDVV